MALSIVEAHGVPADSWARAGARLVEAGRIREQDARHLRWLDAFGALIANTDRHHHNIVFLTEGSNLHLAPAFDQASMLYAPTTDGQVLEHAFPLPLATADTLDVWDDALAAARDYWLQAADDHRLSDDIRRITTQNAPLLHRNP